MHSLRALVMVLVAVLPLAAAEQPERGFVVKRRQSQDCIALVVGNAAYPDQPLKNPVNDATDTATALERLGFTVTRVLNADRVAFQKAVEAFGKAIIGKQAACFYFAGHGIQVQGENYLLPLGEELNNEAEVPFKAVNAGFVLAQMEAAKCPINLVVLDACRNNPLAKSGRSAVKGLAQVQGPAGSLIVYATAPGQIAGDGDGRNGVFTGAFLKHLATPGQDIDLFLRVVSGTVQQVSSGKQIPWRSSNLTQGFCFMPAPTVADLEAEHAARTSLLGTLEAQQAAMEQQRSQDDALIKAKEADIAALERKIAEAQTKMHAAGVGDGGDFEAIVGLVEAKEKQAADLAMLQQKAEAARLLREQQLADIEEAELVKRWTAVAADLSRYRRMVSSDQGTAMKDQAWTALLRKYGVSGIPAGHETALFSAMGISVPMALSGAGRTGDLSAAARLVGWGDWNRLGRIDPHDPRVVGWRDSRQVAQGYPAAVIWAETLANWAVRHRDGAADSTAASCLEARSFLSKTTIPDPIIASEYAWLLHDYQPVEASRIAELARTWTPVALAYPGSEDLGCWQATLHAGVRLRTWAYERRPDEPITERWGSDAVPNPVIITWNPWIDQWNRLAAAALAASNAEILALARRNEAHDCRTIGRAHLLGDAKAGSSKVTARRLLWRAAGLYGELHEPLLQAIAMHENGQATQPDRDPVGGSWEQAVELHRAAGELARSANNLLWAATMLEFQAWCTQPERNPHGDWNRAAALYRQSAELRIGGKVEVNRARSILWQGYCLSPTRNPAGDREAAMLALHEAERLATEAGNPGLAGASCEQLFDLLRPDSNPGGDWDLAGLACDRGVEHFSRAKKPASAALACVRKAICLNTGKLENRVPASRPVLARAAALYREAESEKDAVSCEKWFKP